MENERIKSVRIKLGLSQKEFGERVGISRDMIANIENDRVEVKPLLMQHLCDVFHVDFDWLRTGDGEMFVKTDDSAFSDFISSHGLDDSDAAIMRAYIGLPPASRASIHDFVRRAVDLLPAQSDIDLADRVITEQLQNHK